MRENSCFAVLALFSALSITAPASIIYWDNGNNNGLWESGGNWSNSLSGNGMSNGGGLLGTPDAGDVATFNASSVTSDQNVTIGALGASVDRAVFSTAGHSVGVGSSTGAGLTIVGTNGITVNSGSGAVTIGTSSPSTWVNVFIGNSQTWTNNSASTLTIHDSVAASGIVVPRTLTLTGSGNTVINGQIWNGVLAPLSLVKSGDGTLTLAGANYYTGTTLVEDGTLVVNGNQSGANGAVTIATGGTLSGTGTIGGATTIQSGGTHAVGTAGTIGTQNFSSAVTYSADSIFSWDLSVTTPSATNSATTYDRVGAAAAGGGADFLINLSGSSFSDAFWDVNHSWSDIFTGTGSLAAVFSSIQSSAPSNQGHFSFGGSTGHDLTWTVASPVPEPGNALAGALIAAGLLGRRRSNRKSRVS